MGRLLRRHGPFSNGGEVQGPGVEEFAGQGSLTSFRADCATPASGVRYCIFRRARSASVTSAGRRQDSGGRGGAFDRVRWTVPAHA